MEIKLIYLQGTNEVMINAQYQGELVRSVRIQLHNYDDQLGAIRALAEELRDQASAAIENHENFMAQLKELEAELNR